MILELNDSLFCGVGFTDLLALDTVCLQFTKINAKLNCLFITSLRIKHCLVSEINFAAFLAE